MHNREYIEKFLDEFIKTEYRGHDHVLAREHYRDVFNQLIPRYFVIKEGGVTEESMVKINRIGDNKLNNQERKKVDERNLNASLLSFSIENEIEKLHNESGWTERDRNAITLQKDDNLRVVLMSLHKGTVLQEHKAEGAITLFVLSGKIVFTAENKAITVEANGYLVLDKPVVHRVEALEETNFILTVIRNKENYSD